ncbi:penicillin-binding transpeptidase domain-containing protein [Cellulosilyticum sp. I15G10I2]|uniref:penicillin-binding transpeptidase domain-containing protein n=1 Tax=Cellulosilyticum sp. I15G10I2 TaxID=1892843 RepID=UPI00085C6B50|nr:penicillin-binding transpeptidase domain-containing protein [Cellulosilyticum sp. I15G10I2]
MKKGINKLLLIFKNRIFIMFITICFLFLVLLLKFYTLQVINYDQYANDLRASVQRTIEIPATRGLIFDRYGRPLAVNKPMNVLKFDQQVRMKKSQLNQTLLDVMQVIEKNGDRAIDNVPISKKAPFEFTGEKSQIKSFIYSIPYNSDEHRQELLTYTAPELVNYLKKQFEISDTIGDSDARKIIGLRSEIYKLAYYQYKLVNIATNISDKTVNEIEENHSKFPGVIVDVEPIRHYTEGELFGNILGYTRTITDAQYEQMKDLGYDKTDVVGQVGIEQSMEQELRGQKGSEVVEVDNLGRRVHTIAREDQVQGNNIFLTVDLDFQRDTYDSIERRLSAALVERLKGGTKYIKPLKSKELIISMIESNQLSINEMQAEPLASMQNQLYTQLIKAYEEIDVLIRKDLSLKELLIQWLEEDTGLVTEKQILLAMHEQGSITLSDNNIKIMQGNLYGSTEQLLIEQLEKGYLKPKQLAVDPFSAAAVAVDVNTGEVLSIVGYPSFDSNEMIMNFNQYWSMLFDGIDKRSMLWNRSLMTTKAPGSTFKMITGIAGLEEEVITPSTVIFDTGTFTKAGEPYPRCWVLSRSGGGHGNTNLSRALEVSCNYFFYEVVYRLSKGAANPYTNIDTLTKYVQMFGLDQSTGIELAETPPNVSTPRNLVQRRITDGFNSLKNMNPDITLKRITDIKDTLSKGVYPVIDSGSSDLNTHIDYLIQYELKRKLEPALQEALASEYDELLGQFYTEISTYLQLSADASIRTIVNNTINDISKRSLKLKTKGNLLQELDAMIGDPVYKRLKLIIDAIDPNAIIDAYDHAYTVAYRNEVRKNSNSEIAQELNRRINELDSQKDYYKEYIMIKIRANIINAIANNLLSGIEMEWTDGLTVRTAIGQGFNAFSPLQMSRYIAGIANGKQTFDLKIVNGIFDNKGALEYTSSGVKNIKDIQVSENTMSEIHKGMLAVTKGREGTAREVFNDLPFDVAGKTGTAQEGSHEHSWFVGFAPFDKPEIAIVVAIYNSDGLGKYGNLIAKDMLMSYFKLNLEGEKTTLDNMFIE